MSAANGYDYVVVGAGTAGCIIAARLSEDPSRRVLLIEAGGSDEGFLTRIPILHNIARAPSPRNWTFLTEAIPALGGRQQIWNQGRIIGGSSSINGMVYMRGYPEEYDPWQRAGGKEWSYKELLPYFKRCESHSRGESYWHGALGPIQIRPAKLDLPICVAFLQAMKESGYAIVEDLNAGIREGFGPNDINVGKGVRMSSARAYLHPIYRRSNLTVMPNTMALRLLIEGGQTRGVEALVNTRRRIFHAGAEVILCAGALISPTLLLVSGIGPPDHLSEMGIRTIVDSPEVGSNLRNHPTYLQQYYCSKPVTGYSYFSPLAAAKSIIQYALWQTGPIAENFAPIGGFIHSDPTREFSGTFSSMLPTLLLHAGKHRMIPRAHGFSILSALGRPYSAGRVRLRSGALGQRPRIYPNSFEDARDMSTLVKAIQIIRRAMQNRCIAQYIDQNRDKQGFSDDPAIVAQSVRATAGSMAHPSGTCRMGSDSRAVLDPQLRVNGIANLRVADNSIMPSPLNCGAHAPALMIGEKASALIRNESVERGI